jgi:hypothetical protein
MQYDNAYRRAFRDVSKTEPLSRIFEYLTDPARQWDAMVMVDEGGLPIAAASGQLLKVPMGGAPRRVLWNEHTWVDPQARRDGRGAKIYRALEDRFLPALVLIEIDNPFGMPTCAASESMCAPLDQAGLTASLGRVKFWSHLGFEMVSVKTRSGAAIPFPYTQISLNAAAGQRPCEGLFIACRVLAPELRGLLRKEDFERLYYSTQSTIDPACNEYPSYQATLKHIRKVQKSVMFAPITSEVAVNALAANVVEKVPYLLSKEQVDQPGGLDAIAA